MAGTSTNTQTSGKSQTITVGQYGGTGGNGWDDGSYTGIREIEISYKDAIGAFNVTYDLNGKPFQGPKHPGTEQSFIKKKIVLQFPEEFLVSVSGYFGPWSQLATKTPVIRSLTFKTNKRTFEPFGKKEGRPFDFSIENGLIVGFKGRSGNVLDALSFHLSL